jgi:WD40 repeat protein
LAFALTVLADGRLALGLADDTIGLWNPATGVCDATLHTGAVFALTVLADGRLASGSRDGTIKLWNPANGVCEATLEGHTAAVFALAVLSDGRLVSGSIDHTIRVWQFRDGRWTGAVRFVANAFIAEIAFDVSTGVVAAGDQQGCMHFLRVAPAAGAANRIGPNQAG